MMTTFALPKSGLAVTGRLLLGFLLGLLVWKGFAAPYERLLAAAAEFVLRATENPAVTWLRPLADSREILVERQDFPPSSPRPGIPAGDLHFNFVILAALFALHAKPWRGDRVGAFFLVAGVLCLVHVVALFFQVRTLYATRLGPWSAANYGPFARNFWATGFHFHQLVGRFAAPFVLWWPFALTEQGQPRGRVSASRPFHKRRKRERENDCLDERRLTRQI
ncbi:MAG TPA: hypothetical protein VMR54_10600 [Thermoanaerobaculia bacterium]|nr:hypothetical protein [Thermoanaerobaculia bacterium]